MVAYHQHNEHQQTPLLVQRLKSGESMALVSDAGTPGISDAAFLLVRACLSEGIKVKCLPGATALIPALIESGFPTRQFMFAGFLPQKKGRQSKLKELCETQSTLILYESPARLLKLLEEIAKHFGKERKVSVSRELTKMHEETVRGTASELLSHFQQKAVKGELVVVIAPAG
jgi:16S rRNA (cytidine1402-2'-O)-methyltransferase